MTTSPAPLADLLRRTLAAAVLVLAGACAPAPEEASIPDEPAYRQQIEQWRAERLAGLKNEDGWLTLVGLHWLDPLEEDGAAMTLGSDPLSDVVLPAESVPRVLGTLERTGGKLQLALAPGIEVTLERGEEEQEPATGTVTLWNGAPEEAPVVRLGPVSFLVIQRGERLGLRVRDNDNPARAQLGSLDYYPIDPDWKIEARFVPYRPPKSFPIPDVTGGTQDLEAPGALELELDGETVRIEAFDGGEDELFLIFADETSGKTTYGAGRYLYAERPGDDGTVTVDFNKAYNPPCAFTEYATCPLPPRENRLPVAIEAGERYGKHGKEGGTG